MGGWEERKQRGEGGEGEMGWNKGVPEGGKRWTEKRREKEKERRETGRGR